MLFKKSDKTVSAAILGFLTALLIVIFRGFFSFSHRIVYFSFWPNFIELFLFQTLIPIAILYGIFFFVDHDDIDYKVKAYIPLTMSFYVIFLPYSVISATESMYAGFYIFIKPALCVVMILLSGLFIKNIFSAVQNQKKVQIYFNSVLLFLAFAIPSVIEVCYLLSEEFLIPFVMSGCYLVFFAGAELLQLRK